MSQVLARNWLFTPSFSTSGVIESSIKATLAESAYQSDRYNNHHCGDFGPKVHFSWVVIPPLFAIVYGGEDGMRARNEYVEKSKQEELQMEEKKNQKKREIWDGMQESRQNQEEMEAEPKLAWAEGA